MQIKAVNGWLQFSTQIKYASILDLRPINLYWT